MTVWLTPAGEPVACRDKLRVLDENLAEAQQVLHDAFEDAVLMGVDPQAIRQALVSIIAHLPGPS